MRKQHADGEFLVSRCVAGLRLAIFAGRETALGSQRAGKVRRVAETGGERNLGDRVMRGAQEGERTVQPKLEIDLTASRSGR